MRIWCDSISGPLAVAVVQNAASGDQIFNTTTGLYEALPANGVPLAAHLIQLTRVNKGNGSFGNAMWADLPSAALVQHAAVVALSVGTNGLPVGAPTDEVAVTAIDTGQRAIRLTLGPP